MFLLVCALRFVFRLADKKATLSASDVAEEECSELIFYKQLAPNMLLRLGARRSEIVYKYDANCWKQNKNSQFPACVSRRSF